MRYLDGIGVILSYYDVAVESQSAKVLIDVKSSYFSFLVRVTALLFTPKIANVLVGVVNNLGLDHIGILVHGVFSASVQGEHTSLFECNLEEMCWLSKKDSSVAITVGSIISFRVKCLAVGRDIFAIIGEMSDEETKVTEDRGSITSTPSKKRKFDPPEDKGENIDEDIHPNKKHKIAVETRKTPNQNIVESKAENGTDSKPPSKNTPKKQDTTIKSHKIPKEANAPKSKQKTGGKGEETTKKDTEK